MSRLLLAALLACLAGGALAQAGMRESVERVLATLPAPLRAQATKPFEDRDRVEWHYTPRSRNGVSFKEMDKPAREATHALLRGV